MELFGMEIQKRQDAYQLLALALRESRGLTRMPELDRRPGGKPYFPHEEGLEFNLSHSGHLALCALDNAPVGARHPDGQRVAARTARPGLWSGRVGLAGRAVGLVEVLFPAMVTEREPGQRERAGIEGDHPVHPGPDDGRRGNPADGWPLVPDLRGSGLGSRSVWGGPAAGEDMLVASSGK